MSSQVQRETAEETKPLCFVIGPFGEKGSEIRKWSDFLFKKIIEPVAGENYEPQRTLDDPEPGEVTARIMRDLEEADVVIADLTDWSPNVFYELGVRHALDRPFIHMCRVGTKLPFNLRTFDVIEVEAEYVQRFADYVMPEEIQQQTQERLRAEIEKLKKRSSEGGKARPSEPYLAKVYDWTTQYSVDIHTDWLTKQESGLRDVILRYEHGGGDDVPAECVRAFAEYLQLKSAANQRYKGRMFYVVSNSMARDSETDGEIVFGYAMYEFANAAPMPIEMSGRQCSGGTAEIRFVQPGRRVSVGKIMAELPGYEYTVQFTRKGGQLIGTILHPHTGTLVGEAYLTPRWGFR